MKQLRYLLLLAVPLLALSQSTTEVGNWPNDTSPTQFARFLVEEGCASFSPCTGSTKNIAWFQVESFANWTNGINTTGTGVCSGGCSISGAGISAAQINGVVVGANWSLAGTSSGGALVDIEPTAGGCIGVSAGQIFQNCVQLPGKSFAQITAITCNSANFGLEYMQTDALALSSTTRGGAMTNSASTHQSPVVCTDSGWVYQ